MKERKREKDIMTSRCAQADVAVHPGAESNAGARGDANSLGDKVRRSDSGETI